MTGVPVTLRALRPLTGLLAVAIAVVAVALVATAPIVKAQDIELPEELDPVLAVVSPVANPACEASGSATLIVPVVSNLVNDNLDTGGSLSLDDLILDSLGPVYMVCGLLPAAPDSTCELDNQIAAAMPEEITSFGLPPTLIGDLADLLDTTLGLLGLTDAGVAVSPVLECTVRSDPGAAEPPAPPQVAPAPAAPPVTPPSTPPPAVAAPSTGAGLDVAPAPVVNTPAAPTNPTTSQTPTSITTVAEVLDYVVPSWIRILQLMAAGALVAFLAASWATSARIRRAAA